MSDKFQKNLLLFVFATGLTFTIYFLTPLTDHYNGIGFDGRFYAAMAFPQDKIAIWTHHAPWCWRIFTPYIVGALPFNLLDNFLVLAVTSAILNLFLVGLILKELRKDFITQIFGISLYASHFFTTRWSFYSPCYIDYQTQFFILLTIYALLKGYFKLLPLIIFLATLHKESLIFLSLPCALFYYDSKNTKENNLNLLRNTHFYFLFLFMPAIAAIGATRFFIPAINSYSTEAVLLATFTKQVFSLNFWPLFLLSIFSGLGILPLLAILYKNELKEYLVNNRFWIVFFILTIPQLFGGDEKARLFLPMLITLFFPLMAILPISNWSKNISGRIWLSTILATSAYFGHFFSPIKSYEELTTTHLPLLSGQFNMVWAGIILVLSLIFLALGRSFISRNFSKNENL